MRFTTKNFCFYSKKRPILLTQGTKTLQHILNPFNFNSKQRTIKKNYISYQKQRNTLMHASHTHYWCKYMRARTHAREKGRKSIHNPLCITTLSIIKKIGCRGRIPHTATLPTRPPHTPHDS
jgi:hypothetical protein